MNVPTYVNYYTKPQAWMDCSWFKSPTFTTAYLTPIVYVIDYEKNCIRQQEEWEITVGNPSLMVHTIAYRLHEINQIVIISYHLQQRYVFSQRAYKLCQMNRILNPTNYKLLDTRIAKKQ